MGRHSGLCGHICRKYTESAKIMYAHIRKGKKLHKYSLGVSKCIQTRVRTITQCTVVQRPAGFEVANATQAASLLGAIGRHLELLL